MQWIIGLLLRYILYFIVIPSVVLVLIGILSKSLSSFDWKSIFPSKKDDKNSRERSDSSSFQIERSNSTFSNTSSSFGPQSTKSQQMGYSNGSKSKFEKFSKDKNEIQLNKEATSALALSSLSLRGNHLIRKLGLMKSGTGKDVDSNERERKRKERSFKISGETESTEVDSFYDSDDRDSFKYVTGQEMKAHKSNRRSGRRSNGKYTETEDEEDEEEEFDEDETEQMPQERERSDLIKKKNKNKSKDGKERSLDIGQYVNNDKKAKRFASSLGLVGSSHKIEQHFDSTQATTTSRAVKTKTFSSFSRESSVASPVKERYPVSGRSVFEGAKKIWSDKRNFFSSDSTDAASDEEIESDRSGEYDDDGNNLKANEKDRRTGRGTRAGSSTDDCIENDRDDFDEDVSSTNGAPYHSSKNHHNGSNGNRFNRKNNKKNEKSNKRNNTPSTIITSTSSGQDIAKIRGDKASEELQDAEVLDEAELNSDTSSISLDDDVEGHQHINGPRHKWIYMSLIVMLILSIMGGLFSYLTFKCVVIKSSLSPSSDRLHKFDEACPASLANVTTVYAKSGSCKLFHKLKVLKSLSEQMIVIMCSAKGIIFDLVSSFNAGFKRFQSIQDDDEQEKSLPIDNAIKDDNTIVNKGYINDFTIHVWNGKTFKDLKQQIVLPKSIVKILDHKPIVEEYILAAVIILSLLYQGISYRMQSRIDETHPDGNYSTANEASNDKSPTSIESRFSGLTGLSPLSEFCLHFTDTLTASGNEIWTLENSLKLPKVVRSDVIEKCGSMLVLVSARVKLDGEREDMLISDVQRAIKLRIPIALVVDGPLADGNISKRFNGKTKEMIETLEKALMKSSSQIYIHSIDMSIGYPYMSEEARKSLANVFERSKKHRNKSYSWDVFVADCGMDPISNEPDNSFHSVKPIRNATNDTAVISNSRRSSPHNMQKAKERKLPPALQLDSEGYVNDSIALSAINHQPDTIIPLSPIGETSIRSHASTISSVQDALTYLVAQIHDPGSVSITQKLIIEQKKQGQIGQSEAEILMKLLSIKIGQPLNDSQLLINDISCIRSEIGDSFELGAKHQPIQSMIAIPSNQDNVKRESSLCESASKVSSIHASAVSMLSSECVVKDTDERQDNMIKSFHSDSDMNAEQTTLPIPQFSRQVTLPSRVVNQHVPNPIPLMRCVSFPTNPEESGEDKVFGQG